MRGDALLFLGILIFIIIVWFAMGGATRPLAFSFATPEAFAGASTTPSLKLGNAGTTTVTNADIASDLAKAQQGVTDLEDNYASGQAYGTPSVNKGYVTIRHSIGSFASDNPNEEYITVSVSSRAPEAGIDISGWQIRGAAENASFAIPLGVNLAHSGTVNTQEPIVLGPGQSAVITIGASPIGISFRENTCTGYLDQFQAFTPPLQHACPVPTSAPDSACGAYIASLSSCTVPLDVPSGLTSACKQFVEQQVNYNGCVDAHQSDPSFLGSEWRIYVGQDSDFFTQAHDTLKLLDSSGNTVDLLSY